jgi:predicted HAD superfamily phosphohydrolase YqeG
VTFCYNLSSLAITLAKHVVQISQSVTHAGKPKETLISLCFTQMGQSHVSLIVIQDLLLTEIQQRTVQHVMCHVQLVLTIRHKVI